MVTHTPSSVSWAGLTGALVGLVPALALGGYLFFLQPTESHPFPELVILMTGAVYLPALWASVAPTRLRRSVLLITSLLMVLVSFVSLSGFFGPTVLLFTLPPALLLLVGCTQCRQQQP